MSLNVGDTLLPGSLLGCLLPLFVGVALLYRREPIRWWGRLWLTAVVCIQLFLSTGLGAAAVRAPLMRRDAYLANAAAARGATAVVLLTPSIVTHRGRGYELLEVSGPEGLRSR